ncbi:MAG TPA: alpha-amylase family glycosyl hydrolase [Candidatus Dormibacteraeota bacterium]|nr:alpha-amylase family glycosyl hydrolase [Candidatus Dormibacteraeota bacterium]
MNRPPRFSGRLRFARFWRTVTALGVLAASLAGVMTQAPLAQEAAPKADAPSVSKIEPPNWWVGLTEEVLVLVSGKHLETTHAECNLPTVKVSRTQSSAGGDYLFVWLKIGAETRSGTIVCRLATPSGATAFELPLASRKPTLGRFQGLAANDVMYLIMPDRFANGDPSNDEPADRLGSHDRSKPRAYHGGDLRGITQHLPYLKDLGVTTLWLTPIVKNATTDEYHGYGAADLYAVDPHLGSVQDYQELVSEAHKLHMKIFFDAVPNHIGPKHPWVNDPPLPDWFHGTREHHVESFPPVRGSFYGMPDQGPNDLFELLVDPHATDRLKRNSTEGWFFGLLPDMNTENPIVAQYLLQNSIWWTETSGLDGFRIDTFAYIDRKFWAAWHAGLRKLYPNFFTVGEVFHPDPSVASRFAGGQRRWDGVDTGLTTLFDFPMYFVLRDVLLHGAPAGRIADVLRHDSLYPRPNLLMPFFANHDVARFASEKGSSPAKLQLAFGLTLTLRGIPELYYGDEIAMPGGGDPDNRRDFPGGWKEDPRNAFTAEGRTPEQQQIFAYLQKLLRLRREHPALQSGKLWHLSSDASSYVFLRESEDERVVVAFNKSITPVDLRIPLNDTPAKGIASATPLFGDAKATVGRDELTLTLPPESLSIFAVQ